MGLRLVGLGEFEQDDFRPGTYVLLAPEGDDGEAAMREVGRLFGQADLCITKPETLPAALAGLPAVLTDIEEERLRQFSKFGVQELPNGTGWPACRLKADAARALCQDRAAAGTVTWRHVLDEEVQEAFAEDDPAKLRAELVQVAAVAAQWIEMLDADGVR